MHDHQSVIDGGLIMITCITIRITGVLTLHSIDKKKHSIINVLIALLFLLCF